MCADSGLNTGHFNSRLHAKPIELLSQRRQMSTLQRNNFISVVVFMSTIKENNKLNLYGFKLKKSLNIVKIYLINFKFQCFKNRTTFKFNYFMDR